MTILELFFGFLKVGCFSFGGAYAAIPLIRDIVHVYGWLTDEQLISMIAVSESTPGPIMVNLATYVGTSQAGFFGAMAATLAVVLPSFLIVLLITAILFKVIRNPYVQAVLRGVKPCMIGIIFATGCGMIVKNLYDASLAVVQIREFVITAVLACLFFGQKKTGKWKISPMMLIVISAVLGVIVYHSQYL